MSEIGLSVVGVVSVGVIASLVYMLQVYWKMLSSKRKIKNVLVQIRGQVDIKFDLLSKYIITNEGSLNLAKLVEIKDKLDLYKDDNVIDVEELKDYNEMYCYYIRSFNDKKLDVECDLSEKKIGYLKGYYNELVCTYNHYKSNKLNSWLAKVVAIEDEKLY